jgi:hypothetical protein
MAHFSETYRVLLVCANLQYRYCPFRYLFIRLKPSAQVVQRLLACPSPAENEAQLLLLAHAAFRLAQPCIPLDTPSTRQALWRYEVAPLAPRLVVHGVLKPRLPPNHRWYATTRTTSYLYHLRPLLVDEDQLHRMRGHLSKQCDSPATVSMERLNSWHQSNRRTMADAPPERDVCRYAGQAPITTLGMKPQPPSRPGYCPW